MSLLNFPEVQAKTDDEDCGITFSGGHVKNGEWNRRIL